MGTFGNGMRIRVCEKPAVHRYPAAMARRAHGIAVEVVDKYDGDTASIQGNS